MVNRLVEEGKVEGVHFCTLNLEKSVRKVLDGLKWAKFEDGSSEVYGVLMNGATGAHSSTQNALIEVRPSLSLFLYSSPLNLFLLPRRRR